MGRHHGRGASARASLSNGADVALCTADGDDGGMLTPRRLTLALVAHVLLVGNSPAQVPPQGAAEEARAYLAAALDEVQKGSRVYTTDWQALRTEALDTIARAGAQTPAETYPAIRAALARIGDPHSRLLDPTAAKLMGTKRPALATGLVLVPHTGVVAEILPGSPAAASDLAIGDQIVAIAGVPAFAGLPHFEFGRLVRSGQRQDSSTGPLELTVRTGSAEPRSVTVAPASCEEDIAATGRLLAGGIGYIELHGVASGPKAAGYDDQVHALIAQLGDGAACGWIVDLRRNAGGKVEPMLAGIGPLAGSGKLGAYVSAHATSEWSYDPARGSAIFEGYELASVATPAALRDRAPVAVLTSPITAQAGEALVVAFSGRAEARRFGEGTRGVPVGSTTARLADGALLVLTVTVYSDRAGTRFDGVIPPDEPVAIDWQRLGAQDDPVIAAACRWLAALR